MWKDEVASMPVISAKKKNAPRISVSAEAYGEWNKKEAFQPKVIPKSETTIPKYRFDPNMPRIKELLNRSFMFQELEPKSISIIVNAMEELKVKPGETVIKQNEEGMCLYIVESGTLVCTKLFVCR